MLNQFTKKSPFGLVINWGFHVQDRWVSSFGPYLVEAIIRTFDPIIIRSQLEYELHKRKLRYIFSMEPVWSAPRLRYRKNHDHVICLFVSDPHNKTEWLQQYVTQQGVNHVLCPYQSPFFYHFPSFPEGRFVHFPWAVPDKCLSRGEITVRNKDVIIFGGRESSAYDMRNWCREQEGVINYDNSGCENKVMRHDEYYSWLTQFDAIIAAGSSDPKYDLVTPKYFEIASAGALLIGQRCKDLDLLGFDPSNSLIFTRETFHESVLRYKEDPEHYLSVRENGRKLIRERHLISHRIQLVRGLFGIPQE